LKKLWRSVLHEDRLMISYGDDEVEFYTDEDLRARCRSIEPTKAKPGSKAKFDAPLRCRTPLWHNLTATTGGRAKASTRAWRPTVPDDKTGSWRS
jgi:hypothetical protein